MTDKEKYIGKAKMTEKPKKSLNFKLGDKCIKNKHIDDAAVDTRTLKDKAVTPEKLNERVKPFIINDLDNKYDDISKSLDEKYSNITNELYDMIASLQVGGIALSGQFGDRTDIGIHQKALTKAIGAILDILGNITHHDYMDFTLTVVPSSTIAEGDARVTVKADCTDAISDFDNIKIYRDGELVTESHDLSVFTTTVTVSGDSTVIRAAGTIMGKTIFKEQTVTKLFPFFMGGGSVYQDVLTPACQKELHGTLEGEYDATISASGQYLFVIIPNSKREEFRRCKMDMSGIEFQFTEEAHSRYLVCKSVNTYQAGTYNIDIDINS